MNDGFDPYSRWLGLPAGPRPPDHYALLGIARQMVDEAAIHAAASERLQRIRDLASHAQKSLRDKLLVEIKAAEVCLANPTTRAAYDVTFPPPTKLTTEAPLATPIGSAASPPPLAPVVAIATSPLDQLRTPARRSLPLRPAAHRRGNSARVWLGCVIVGLAGICVFVARQIYVREREQPVAKVEPSNVPPRTTEEPRSETDATAPKSKPAAAAPPATKHGKSSDSKASKGSPSTSGKKGNSKPVKTSNSKPEEQQPPGKPNNGSELPIGKQAGPPTDVKGLPAIPNGKSNRGKNGGAFTGNSQTRSPEEIETEVANSIKELMESPDPRARRNAATQLASIGAAANAAVPELRKGLLDSDDGVKEECAKALGAIGETAEEALNDLAKLIENRDTVEHLRGTAGEAIISIDPGSTEARKLLTRLLVGGAGATPRRLEDLVARRNRTWALQQVARAGAYANWSWRLVKEVVEDSAKNLDEGECETHFSEGVKALVAIGDDSERTVTILKKFQKPNALRTKNDALRQRVNVAIDTAIKTLQSKANESEPEAS